MGQSQSNPDFPPRVRPEPQPPERKCLVLVGTTGTGKSTLGNILLGLDPSVGFKASGAAASCTTDVKTIDGRWLGGGGDPWGQENLIRVIDTPGHGDGEGKDYELRLTIVNAMKKQKKVHAFIWVKNSASPRFDKNDREFLEIFKEMFGPGFLSNVVIVFSRFSYSEDAKQMRERSGASLQVLINGLRASIPDPEGSIPVYAIDAFYRGGIPVEKREFDRGTEALWRTISGFSAQPVEDLQIVGNIMGSLVQELNQLRRELKNLRIGHQKEKSALERKMQEQERKYQELEERVTGPTWVAEIIPNVMEYVEKFCEKIKAEIRK